MAGFATNVQIVTHPPLVTAILIGLGLGWSFAESELASEWAPSAVIPPGGFDFYHKIRYILRNFLDVQITWYYGH